MPKSLSFQELIQKLNQYWAEQGCLVMQPYDLEVGAGTFSPHTFLRALGPEPWKAAYVEPSRRPTDGRYGENPHRTQQYYQYQVILKPSPKDAQQLYLDSLKALGINLLSHDIRFVEDDWESPTLGAWGLGWEVWLDSQEITQFTYFQQCGSIDLEHTSCEITYGLERIAMFLQKKESLFDIEWGGQRTGEACLAPTYGNIHIQGEKEFSAFNFEGSNPEMSKRHFEDYEKLAKELLEKELVLPAYDCCLKTSHLFNLLDARGAVSVNERPRYISRVRSLARACAEGYLKSREAQGFPLLKTKDQRPKTKDRRPKTKGRRQRGRSDDERLSKN